VSVFVVFYLFDWKLHHILRETPSPIKSNAESGRLNSSQGCNAYQPHLFHLAVLYYCINLHVPGLADTVTEEQTVHAVSTWEELRLLPPGFHSSPSPVQAR
jgi:hypothetical protein